MKKILVLVFVIVLLLVMVVPVSAEGFNNWSQFCSYFDDFGGTHGQCVSFFNAEANAYGHNSGLLCDAFDNFGATHGQCVSYLVHIMN